MIRQLRSSEKLKRILWIGLLLIIIPSFIAFYGGPGGGMGTGGSNSAIVTINYPEGKKGELMPLDINSAQNSLQQQMQQHFMMQGKQLPPNAANQLVDTRAAIEQAINLDILRNYAEVNGLTVSMQEIIDRYQESSTAAERQQMVLYLAQQGMELEDYLEVERRSRLIGRAAESIGAKARVTNYEAWQEFAQQNETLVVDYYRVNASDFMASVTITDEGLTKFFEENKEDFRIPDQVRYQYVMVRKNDLKSSITLTDDEVTSYYANRQEDFRLPRQVDANQIFLKLPSREELNSISADSLTSITEAVMAKAEDIYDRAAKGEDFKTLADTFNEETTFPPRVTDDTTTATDTHTTAGGHLGVIDQEIAQTFYGDDWTSAVFNAQPGTITRPIRTPNGIVVVQVNRLIDGKVQPLADVRTSIENSLRDEKVGPIFEAKGEELQEIAESATSLQQIARETSTTVQTTDKVNRDANFITGIGMLGDFELAVRDLQKGGHSDVLTDAQRHLIIQIQEEFPTHLPELADVRGRVEQAYRQQLASDAAKKKAEEVLAASKDFAAFEKAVNDAGTTYTQTRPFKRSEATVVFGTQLEDFNEQSIQASPGDINLSKGGGANTLQQTYVVWHLNSVNEPDKVEFADKLSEISQQVMMDKQNILMLEYIREQRERLGDRIKINVKL